MTRRLIILILPILLLTSGCSFQSGRVRLFNYDMGSLWGSSSPDQVTVHRGDTLYSISRRYNVPLRDVIEANRLSPPYNLYPGQILRLPTARFHIVAKGDTFYNISKRYNVDMNSLSRINNISAPYALRIGQKLVLPGSVVDSSVVSTPYSSASAAQKKTTTTQTAAAAPKSSGFSFWGQSSKKESTPKKAAYTAPAPVKKRTTKFMWPVQGTVISNFGPIGKGRNNDGINIKAPLGTTVKSADAGTIAYAGNELKGFGNLILIKHDDGWITAYAHNDKILVKKGQKVRRGEKIATVGSTGGVNTPQLHFEVRSGKKAVNPRSYLQ